jgi:hypothetical protein
VPLAINVFCSCTLTNKVEKMAELHNGSDAQLQFLLEVLQSIEQNDGDPQVIHPLFLENLTLLNDEMISLINALMNSMPADVEKNEQKFIRPVRKFTAPTGSMFERFLIRTL